MDPQTASEKILSAHAGRRLHAGELAVCAVDAALGTDASTPMALDYFAAMGGERVRGPERLLIALDHYVPPGTPALARLHQRLRDFAAGAGIELWEAGEGISHQLMVESGRARPGALAVAADSHATTYGALNCFATGIGSSDLAGIFLTGQLWLRVPASIRIELRGRLQRGVSAKDIGLALARQLGSDGANYHAIEYAGDALAALDLDNRLVLANLAVEMGAKNAIFPADAMTARYLGERGVAGFAPVAPDAGAAYARHLTLTLDTLEPLVALPHQVGNVVSLREVPPTPVHMVYLGTCTGGRVRDYHEALAVLDAGGGVAPGVQLVVTPASRSVLEALAADGTLAGLLACGAVLVPPGCGSCCGTCGIIPGDGINVVSTANRNFLGRMGNPRASIFLASPASCAAAAVRGHLVDPRELLP